MPDPPATPGVYVRESSEGVPPIQGTATGVAGFVGRLDHGPEGVSIPVTSFTDFTRVFGGSGASSPTALAVRQFFLNGGRRARVVRVSGLGRDGGELTPEALVGSGGIGGGMEALGMEWDLLCLPDVALLEDPDRARSTYRSAADHCQERRAFLLVDLPPTIVDPRRMVEWVEGGGGLRHPNAALHAPRLVVADPTDPTGERTVGSSGSIAGLYARTDVERGVWKAPAGRAASLRHVLRPARDLDRAALELLNPEAVNAVLVQPGIGVVSWGARTLAGQDAGSSEWRYVPVRRLALHIERSLDVGLKWTVFEADSPGLWARIRTAVDAFFQSLFRAGAQGRTADEAWYTRCGPDTTTEAERRAGTLILEVGFAPLKPAEFAVLRVRLETRRP